MQKTYIYGRNTITDAIKNIKIYHIYFLNDFKDNKILNLVKNKKIEFSYVDSNKLKQLSNNGNHQGVVAEIDRFEYSSLQDIISNCKKVKNPLILILDGITDPMNFGAIIRSADAFNVQGIIIKKHNQVMVTPSVYKVSTGAINHVKIALVANLNQTLETLKKEGFWSVGSDGNAQISYQDLKYDFPCALIVGSEGFGISKLLLSRCDYVVKIDMFGHVNSLNASVACGILLSHIKNCNKK